MKKFFFNNIVKDMSDRGQVEEGNKNLYFSEVYPKTKVINWV